MRNIFDKHNITDEIYYRIEKLIENTARKSSGTNSIWCHNKERAIELDKFIISCTFLERVMVLIESHYTVVMTELKKYYEKITSNNQESLFLSTIT